MIRIILACLTIIFMGLFYLWLVDHYRYGCAVCWVLYPIMGVFIAWVFESGLEKISKNY